MGANCKQIQKTITGTGTHSKRRDLNFNAGVDALHPVSTGTSHKFQLFWFLPGEAPCLA
jgi:hypothetical protein